MAIVSQACSSSGSLDTYLNLTKSSVHVCSCVCMCVSSGGSSVVVSKSDVLLNPKHIGYQAALLWDP